MNIDDTAIIKKCAVYAIHGSLQDLHDICSAIISHAHTLNPIVKECAAQAITAKGIEYIDYAVLTQADIRIDALLLKKEYATAADILGIILSEQSDSDIKDIETVASDVDGSYSCRARYPMHYITGIHALNLECPLDTCGDWHQSALKWERLTIADTGSMFFGDYGITLGVPIPKHYGPYPVANHIRALLDLIEWGNFAAAQGMNNDFICNPRYDVEIFKKVWSMRELPNWEQIDAFIGKEYMMKWIRYKQQVQELADGRT